MKKYAKIIKEETKQCDIALGWYIPDGFAEMEVEQAYDGFWYLAGYAPVKPTPTHEEVAQTRRQLYIAQKDPITCQIQSLRDEEQTDEIIAEIEALKVERAEIVAKIKEENPYPVEEVANPESGVLYLIPET